MSAADSLFFAKMTRVIHELPKFFHLTKLLFFYHPKTSQKYSTSTNILLNTLLSIGSWIIGMCNTSIPANVSNFSQQYITCMYCYGSLYGCCKNSKKSMGTRKIILCHLLCSHMGNGCWHLIANDCNLSVLQAVCSTTS